MGKIGFFEVLLDDNMSWWEAERINQAQDAADVAQGVADAAQYKTFTLETRINQMQREIVLLRTALTVVCKTLKDSNVLDERLLDARLEAALEEVQASMPKQPGPGALSVNAALNQAGPAPAQAMLTCTACGKQVPASATLMTGDGPVCERC